MNSANGRGWSSFFLGVATILFVWTIVLPWLGTSTSIESRIEHLDHHGIDPSALYYTDLEAMQRIEANVAAVAQTHPEAFWRLDATAGD